MRQGRPNIKKKAGFSHQGKLFSPMYTGASNLHPVHLDSLAVLLFLGSVRLRMNGNLKFKPGMILASLFKMIWRVQLWSAVEGVLNLWTVHCACCPLFSSFPWS